MSRRYKKIDKLIFANEKYSLVPVRDEDKYAILKWRNEQIDVLRQAKPLTKDEQENYFKNVIDKLFEQETPEQLIFSFLESGKLIGYGGLVHIDWKNKAGEISFLTETSRNSSKEIFISDWTNYLSLIKQVAEEYLKFKSIYTYAYDIRPALYVALDRSGFKETSRMKDQVKINNELKDVVIHTFNMSPLNMELTGEEHVDLYFKWANDPEVRKFSFQQDEINYEDHVKWFNSKINNPDFRFYLFRNEGMEAVGQVRINRNGAEIIIGISIDPGHRGLGYGSKMLRMACSLYFAETEARNITAYIKTENKASEAIFKKAGFVEKETLLINTKNTIKLILKNEQF